MRNSIIFLVSHEKFKSEKNATCSSIQESRDKFLSLKVSIMRLNGEVDRMGLSHGEAV